MASMYYFGVARRLKVVGNTDFEFMSEIILNYHKVLEILFGPSREKIREGLTELNYSKDDIEEKFIPLTILRNQIDVGHVTTIVFKEDFLKELYRYLYCLEVYFIDFFEKLINKITKKEFVLKAVDSIKPDREKQKIIDGLLKTIRQHNSKTAYKDIPL